MARPIHGQFQPNGLIQKLDMWPAGVGPLYRRLATALRAAIARGDLTIGEPLPPERILAQQLAVSRGTVVAAYELLVDERLLERRQGSGTRVRAAPAQRGTGLTAALNRNTLFRRVIDGPGGTVDLTGAYLIEPGGLSNAVLEDLNVELVRLAETSGYAPLGYQPLRQAIADQFCRRGVPTVPEQVLVTSGSQQAIHLVAWLMLQRSDPVVVENPTYPGALDAFTAVGARLVGVRTRRTGVELSMLEDLIGRFAPRLAYVIPTYHNPVGGVLSEPSRRGLAELVARHQLPLLEDDSLASLSIVGDPPPPVAAFAPNAPILSIGSLSKLCWAGLRVGWIRAPEPIVAQLGRLKAVTDLGGSLPAQVIATRLLGNYAAIERERRPIIGARLELVTRLLSELLPAWTWDNPQGGLCLWVRLPYGSATEFAQVALRGGVSIVAGSVASCDGTFDDYVRLPFGQRPDVLEQGIRRLAEAWRQYTPAEVPAAGQGQSMAVIV